MVIPLVLEHDSSQVTVKVNEPSDDDGSLNNFSTGSDATAGHYYSYFTDSDYNKLGIDAPSHVEKLDSNIRHHMKTYLHHQRQRCRQLIGNSPLMLSPQLQRLKTKAESHLVVSG